MYRRIYVLRFPKDIIDHPIICKLVKQFDLEFNILKATILLQHEGLLVIELSGHKTNIKKGMDYLKEQGVKVENLAAGVRRDDDKCYQCGICTSVCPTGALHIERPEMAVLFSPEKCSGCGLCVTICPARAMNISLDQTVNLLNGDDLA